MRLLQDYVRLQTTPSKGERAGVEFLKDLLDCDGIENEIVCPAPERCNLLARLPGRTREGSLLLLNHVDVVEAFPDFWKDAPPFEGRIKLGYLYGRGSYDMKSFGLAQAIALREIKRLGIVPRTDILFLAEADEEMGQKWGSRWLLDHRPEWFEGLKWVINEGGATELILRKARFWGIETVQAGYASGEFEAPRETLLALAKAFPKIDLPPVDPLPDVAAGFDMLANHLPNPYTDPLRHLDRVRRDPKELAILPDRYAAFLEGRIHWSDLYNHPDSPGKMRGNVTISVPPGVAPRPYLDPILADAARREVRVVSVFDSGPTKASLYPSAMTDLLKRVTEAHYPGVPFGPLPGFGGFTTSLLYRNRGYQTYGYSPFAMNITDTARRHWNDERIYLRDYLTGIQTFTDAMLEYALVGAR
ncbi:MAG TPA: M20/M25/M40 family metallo-hydrolase [Thermoanaerobaculia bacterium]|nr:M20/M25/M40 family metallo-hydrolase [Thermoanaerobaculia bacterium]